MMVEAAVYFLEKDSPAFNTGSSYQDGLSGFKGP